ncbi:MAG: hypothetical protein ACXAEF_15280, partial [Candidatus Thorarchaeota archaeon]
MSSSPVISVIIPIHDMNHKLLQIRRALNTATVPLQVVIVLNNPGLSKHIVPQTSSESVVIAARKGRGFAFIEGAKIVKGTFTMLLHSDTIPNPGWDQAILSAMSDPKVAGGGFTLTYRIR